MPGRNYRVPPLDQVRVWSYWSGPQPPWIGMCLETLRRATPTVEILDDTVWTTLYDGPIPVEAILRQRPNVRSDVLRAWLLHRFGGVWVDADCIVWRDLRAIAGWLEKKEFVCYRIRPHQLCSALIASRRGGHVAGAYCASIAATLAARPVVSTNALGPGLLASIAVVGHRRCHFLRPQLVHPVHWHRRGVLIRPGEFVPRPGSWTFMLGHRSLGRYHWAPREEILASDTMIGSLFRRALG
jgi:hypothetical protein